MALLVDTRAPEPETVRDTERVGICVCGEGARATAVGLGALQVLRATGWMGPGSSLFYAAGVEDGLPDVLRHGCSTVILIDSGDDPEGFPATLGGAIGVARRLGTRVEIGALGPGRRPDEARGRPRDPLAGEAVVSGTTVDAAGRRARLVVATARLTADVPDDVLRYATAHPEFPHGRNGRCDDERAEAYRRLGRHLGAHVVGTLLRGGTIMR